MIRVLQVGLGKFGRYITKNLYQLSLDGRIALSISDLNEKILKENSRKYIVTASSADYEELLSKNDVVVISTPISSHYKIAKNCLLAGKNVIVQKPLAESSKECADLIEIARLKNLKICVSHTAIFSPSVTYIRNFIKNGDLGDLYYFDSNRMNFGGFTRDSNVILDLAVHDIAVLLYTCGPFWGGRVSATGSSILNKTIDIANIVIQNEQSNARIHVNWVSPIKERRMIFIGTKKMLVYNENAPSEKVLVFDRMVKETNDLLLDYRVGDMFSPKIIETEPIYNELCHFLKVLEGKESCLASGEDGLRVVRISEAALKSINLKGNSVSYV